GAGLFLVFWLACLMLNEEVRGFNAGGALVTAHFHTMCNCRNEFLCHGPTCDLSFPDGACFHITHVLCGTHFLSCRKLKWKSYIVVVRSRERGEQRLEASGSGADP
ncbi:hypothetical protein BDR04DRAFT_1085708, partial [Suillus decipiens]